jgi:hypothetical protein
MAVWGTGVTFPVLYAAAEMEENSTSIVNASITTNSEMVNPLLDSSTPSRILLIGATGYIGRFVAQQAVAAGHPTYALIRPSTASDPAKAQRVQELKDSGVHILYVYNLPVLLYKLFLSFPSMTSQFYCVTILLS